MAIVGLLVAASCQKKDNDPVKTPVQAKEIRFTANIYQFTKATDTAFENGDEIGVNIFNPDVYLYNAKFTYTDGQLKSATAHEWYEEDVEATITAVYPCNDTLEGYAQTQSFTVNADQSTKAGYGASDLMFAVTKSKPTKSSVNLPFKHALSKIVVTVDNQLGEDIANVWFTDVLGTVTYDPKDPFEMTTTGSKGTVKAYKNNEGAWQLIVAPQTEASPKLAITTASGKQYTFVLSENVTFTSGKVSTATVTVSTESIYTSFTPEISDWVADNELNFSQDDSEVELPEEPAGNVVYLQVNSEWATDGARFAVYSWNDTEAWTDMTDKNNDGIYACTLPTGHTNIIFCRMNPGTTDNNWDNKWNQTADLTFSADGNCYVLTDGSWEAGTWTTISANE